jgi:hypothetical protein
MVYAENTTLLFLFGSPHTYGLGIQKGWQSCVQLAQSDDLIGNCLPPCQYSTIHQSQTSSVDKPIVVESCHCGRRANGKLIVGTLGSKWATNLRAIIHSTSVSIYLRTMCFVQVPTQQSISVYPASCGLEDPARTDPLKGHK